VSSFFEKRFDALEKSDLTNLEAKKMREVSGLGEKIGT
jgi:hypothetical protein